MAARSSALLFFSVAASAVIAARRDLRPVVLDANSSTSSTKSDTRFVYLGNGCFWYRQYATFTVETAVPFSRDPGETTATSGYAGGWLGHRAVDPQPLPRPRRGRCCAAAAAPRLLPRPRPRPQLRPWPRRRGFQSKNLDLPLHDDG